jgi:hypothetical protein
MEEYIYYWITVHTVVCFGKVSHRPWLLGHIWSSSPGFVIGRMPLDVRELSEVDALPVLVPLGWSMYIHYYYSLNAYIEFSSNNFNWHSIKIDKYERLETNHRLFNWTKQTLALPNKINFNKGINTFLTNTGLHRIQHVTKNQKKNTIFNTIYCGTYGF